MSSLSASAQKTSRPQRECEVGRRLKHGSPPLSLVLISEAPHRRAANLTRMPSLVPMACYPAGFSPAILSLV